MDAIKKKGKAPAKLPKEKLEKYAKMKKMGLPDGAIRHKMKQDGLSADAIADFFANTAPMKEKPQPTETKVANPKLAKYAKMKKMGLPEGAIRHKMTQDGIAKELMAEFFGEKQPEIKKAKKEKVELPPLDENIVGKYRKMKKMGLPDGAIQHKMVQDGIDQAIINQFFNIKPAAKSSGVNLDSPIFEPYKKMKKAGLPPPAIKHKMTMDGRSQDEIRAFFGESTVGTAKASKVNKSKFKKLHWQTLDESKLENSVWGMKVHEDDDDSGDEIDLEKLKSLFSNSPKGRKKKKKRMSQMSKEEAEMAAKTKKNVSTYTVLNTTHFVWTLG